MLDDEPMSTNMVLRGGRVLDLPEGTWRTADVLIEDGTITAVGADLAAVRRRRAGRHRPRPARPVRRPRACHRDQCRLRYPYTHAAELRHRQGGTYPARHADARVHHRPRRRRRRLRTCPGRSRKPCSPALGSSSAATRSRRPAATATCAGPASDLGQCFCCAGFGLIADGVDALRRACREEDFARAPRRSS